MAFSFTPDLYRGWNTLYIAVILHLSLQLCTPFQTASAAGLYPFGETHGDELVPEDKNVTIRFPSPMRFGGLFHNHSILDGTAGFIFSASLLINPYYIPTRYRQSPGKLYYRVSKNESLLDLGIAHTKKAFPKLKILKDFKPDLALVATWHDYPYGSWFGLLQKDTFQIGIFWNSFHTLAFINYIKMENMFSFSYFKISDLQFYFPSNATNASNMRDPGKFCFRIDSTEVWPPTRSEVHPRYSLISGFYPFGRFTGENLLVESSVSISLPDPPKIQNVKRSQVSISRSGVFTFTPKLQVSAFDTNASGDGMIYYSLTHNKRVLELAKNSALRAFPRIPEFKNFTPTHALVLTMDKVIQSQEFIYSEFHFVLSAQALLFWDANITLLCANYKEITKDDYLFSLTSYVGNEEISLLPNFISTSNLRIKGRHCYRIDGAYVQLPTNRSKDSLIMVSKFYPFGHYWNDTSFIPLPNSRKGPISISEEVRILDTNQTQFTITGHGKLIFGSELVLSPLTFAYNVTLLEGPRGNVFYRITKDKSLLDNAISDIKRGFPTMKFTPKEAIIITWYLVPYHYTHVFSNEVNLSVIYKNSFQAIIVWDESSTFSCFVYDRLELGDLDKDPKFFVSYIGEFKTVLHPDMTRLSNVGIPGKYCYRIDFIVTNPV